MLEMKQYCKQASKQASKQARDSSIELLRILSIFGVFILHYNNPLIGKAFLYAEKYSIKYLALMSLEVFSICAVDLFVLLTGYYMWRNNKINFKKPFELVLQVILFALVPFAVKTILTGNFQFMKFVRCFIPSNYFVILYSALYLISPYINIVLQKLNRRQLMRFLIMIIMLFSVWPTFFDLLQGITHKEIMGISTIGAYGSQEGYTIVNFVIMYIIGAYLNILDMKYFKLKPLLLAVVTNSFALLLWGTLDIKSAFAYCNPLVILEAVLYFQIFKTLNLGEVKWINKSAKAVFTVFLLHFLFLYRMHIDYVVANYNILVIVAHITVSFVCVYLVCYCIYVIYQYIVNWFIRYLDIFFEKTKFEV